MAFVYWFVLPVSVAFFIEFNSQIPLKYDAPAARAVATSQPSMLNVPLIGGDPAPLNNGMVWFDTTQDRLKIYLNQQVRTLAFGPDNLLTPMITLPQYIDMVVGMLLAFGLAFQTPLVVLALVRVGIVDVPTLKRLRKYIFFIAAVVAAVIVPDVVTGMIALMLPLYLLYEFGIFLAMWGDKKQRSTE
jgi:Sec-independent protein secretion pathway component TatC